jgi:hypothetical protein
MLFQAKQTRVPAQDQEPAHVVLKRFSGAFALTDRLEWNPFKSRRKAYETQGNRAVCR